MKKPLIAPPPEFSDDLKSGKLRVVKPNPQTGEVTEAIVEADHFKPRQPRLPARTELREFPCQPGWIPLHVFDRLEPEADFWAAHGKTLTREERSQIAGGRTSSVQRPVEPEWVKGDKLRAANNVDVEVIETEENLRGYRTVFRVIDFRPLLPKRIVGGSSKPKTDEQGYPVDHMDETEEQRARVDGAYTTSRALAVADTDDELDDKLHQRLHAEASMARAMSGAKRRKRVTLIAIEERLNIARKKYRAGEVRYLERQKESLKRKEEKAKRAAA